MSFLRGQLTRTQPRLSPPPVHLYSGVGVGSIGVVGESFYRDNLLRLFGRHREGVKERFETTLVWERDNPKDANAVAVCIRGLTVAHLSRSRAAKWRPFMEECARRGLVPTASGIVYAGWDRGPEDWGDFNINLYMEEAPEHDLRRLMDGPRLKAERQAGIAEKAAANPRNRLRLRREYPNLAAEKPRRGFGRLRQPAGGNRACASIADRQSSPQARAAGRLSAVFHAARSGRSAPRE